jgi:hypothetical protein
LISEKKNFIGAGFCILGKTITLEENTLRNVYPVVINFSHSLTTNVTNPEGTEMMKESTLETIGYICMDIVSLLLAL